MRFFVVDILFFISSEGVRKIYSASLRYFSKPFEVSEAEDRYEESGLCL